MKNNRLLYPRLASIDAEARWEHLKSFTISELAAASDVTDNWSYHPATGGIRVLDEQLRHLQRVLRATAEKCGYPEYPNRHQAAEFDVLCSEKLYSEMAVSPGEAARHEIWSFIGLVLLPDVTRWRFPKSGKERFIGGTDQRNALQRLWWRAYALRDESQTDEFHLLRRLAEDALVGIMERPGVSSNTSVALQIARHAASLDDEVAASSLENARREAIKLVRRWIPVVSMDALTDEQLEQRIRQIYDSVRLRYRN